MADFCWECGIKAWGFDPRDVADITTPEDSAAGHFAVIRCERCGPILVDHDGRRVDINPRDDGEAPTSGNFHQLGNRTATLESDVLCALAVFAVLATAVIAILQGSDPRSWISFALSATASLLALRRFALWAGG